MEKMKNVNQQERGFWRLIDQEAEDKTRECTKWLIKIDDIISEQMPEMNSKMEIKDISKNDGISDKKFANRKFKGWKWFTIIGRPELYHKIQLYAGFDR